MFGGAVVIPQQRIQTHDNSRGTESTLAPITLRYTLLRRMRLLHIPYALDRYYMLSVHTGKRRQTGVDAGMIYLFRGWVILTDYDCTGTTTAFSAATR